MAEKLSNKIIRLIKNDIVAGKWAEGSKMPSEFELMELYGVGRSTIREAIKSLADAGILRVQQGSGTFVNPITESENIDQRLKRAAFDEINAVRQMLELEIATLASKNRSANNLREIKEKLQQRKDAIMAEQRVACIDADLAFHSAVAKASANSVLADLYHSFTIIIRDFFEKREKQGISHFAMSHHLHEALYQAIAKGNAEAARQITTEILKNNY
ncbi:DNA-binding FadR family transcriptional regulator [Mucilaginibacter oryzae]|uniref:DNA-binding FadR family transcriptional regulator n=1 Tax=Mucilaginibacter oryzae TaxID=468058 RepID=A0A316HHB1_9SPHI|nr:FadR/GntR family transcriptional regulator [Mucilaginibacter oryzae]PWK79380.1 DNA-binding FadR family transcriptional regulator [Mucilaginibacter oryzae]